MNKYPVVKSELNQLNKVDTYTRNTQICKFTMINLYNYTGVLQIKEK